MDVRYSLEVPAMLVNSERVHNALVKRVVRTAAEFHHEKRIPLHFKQTAHGRYGYAKRTEKYIRFKLKRYGTGIDLVKSGRTKRQMLSQRQLTVGGQASTTGVNATLRLQFAFIKGAPKRYAGKSRGRALERAVRASVTYQQMQREIETIIPSEQREIQQQIHDGYVVLVDTDTSARQRVKVI